LTVNKEKIVKIKINNNLYTIKVKTKKKDRKDTIPLKYLSFDKKILY